MIKFFQKLALVSAITSGIVVQLTPVAAQNSNTIRCESSRGRYHYCQVDTRGGVKFIRQISNTECRQGDNWGYDRGGIWVDRGCSAEFAVRNNNNNNWNGNNNNWNNNNNNNNWGNNNNNNNWNNNNNNNWSNNNSSTRSVTCNSTNDRYTRCLSDIRRGDRVRLKRQLSNSGCWEGDTWGFDRDGIWVDRGCRAVFEIQS